VKDLGRDRGSARGGASITKDISSAYETRTLLELRGDRRNQSSGKELAFEGNINRKVQKKMVADGSSFGEGTKKRVRDLNGAKRQKSPAKIRAKSDQMITEGGK